MSNLKLYVVGETSGNPEDWHHWKRTIAFAHNAQEAVAIAGMGDNEPVAEIVVDEPMILFIEEDCGNDD